MIPFAAISIVYAPLPITARGMMSIVFTPMLLLDVAFQWLGVPVSIFSDAHPRKAWLIANVYLVLTMLLYGYIGTVAAPMFRKLPAKAVAVSKCILFALGIIGLAILVKESIRYL